jgi:hypothetical protein
MGKNVEAGTFYPAEGSGDAHKIKPKAFDKERCFGPN